MSGMTGRSGLAASTVRNWRASLTLGLVVIGVVALLLETLARLVDQIHDGAADIWLVGKWIANNTVHTPLIARVNQTLAPSLGAADETAAATGRIGRALTGEKGS